MGLERVRTVVTPDDLTRVGRFRYEIYVGEQNKQCTYADHVRRTLIEPEDQSLRSQIYWIESGDRILGTVRTQFGPFEPEISERMRLQSLPFDPASQLILFSRMMVATDARRTEVTTNLFQLSLSIALTKNIPAGILTCTPKLVPLFESFGCLAYAAPYVDPQVGPQVPMAVLGEADYMRTRGSPLAEWLSMHRPTSEFTMRFLDCVHKHQATQSEARVARLAGRLVAEAS